MKFKHSLYGPIAFVKIFDKIGPHFVEKFAVLKIFDQISLSFVEILNEKRGHLKQQAAITKTAGHSKSRPRRMN